MDPSRRKPSKFLTSLLYALLELPLLSPDRRRCYTPGPPACIALREKYWKSSDLDTVWEVSTPACRYSRISGLVWCTSSFKDDEENGERKAIRFSTFNNAPTEFKPVQALKDQAGDVVDPTDFIVSLPPVPSSICLDLSYEQFLLRARE